MTSHPTTRLDDVVHQRSRLGIVTLLYTIHKVEFTTLRDVLELTDGNCNRHLAALDAAGLVKVTKSRGPGRTRTWVQLTGRGRAAVREEAAALKELVASLGL